MTIQVSTDPFQNYMERLPQPLDAIFLPKSVAVIGAKDNLGSVGRTILANLIAGSWGGKIYPVNPKRDTVLGLKSYPSIMDVPEPVDLAVVVTPAITVPGIIYQCVEAGVKSAIIISAGFKELGPSGLKLEEEILQYARKGNMPIIGPNCLGVMNPVYGMNATFARGMALPGNVAFISQSGAMCTAVLDWSLQERVGFSSFVSIGSMADVNWGDLIDYLGGDPNTSSILIYMETIGDPRAFLSAAREIALEKPIIVIKPGRSSAAAQAAASHTGSLTGSDEVFEAAMERVGVLRVDTISELFSMASVLARQPKPKGPKLAIVTNAGGPAVLATDATVLNGAELASISPQSLEALNAFLPEAWSHSNPVDILGDAGPERYEQTVKILAKDPQLDGMLVILSPQDVTDPLTTAEYLRPYAHLSGKPILASWMGGASVKSGIEILSQSKIPTFEYPDQAAWTFAQMWKYNANLNALYETPTSATLYGDKATNQQAHELLNKAIQEGRTLLDEYESKAILAMYGIPVVETLIATSMDEAVAQAKLLKYPVVLKLFSKTITHKSDVGGVKLNLKTPDEVAQAFKAIKNAVDAKDFLGVTVQKMIKLEGYELILGSSVDPQFGPIILFGSGGQLVEVFKDRALGLPPLGSTHALSMMKKTKIYEALLGVRGRKPVDIEALTQLLVRFSNMIVANPLIKECDINPLLASPEGFIALDARIVLHESDQNLPRLAIRPYPWNYVTHWTLKNGSPVILRPIKPEDEPLLAAFHKELSEHSVRQRYFDFVSLDDRIAHERLVRICFNDYDREWALVAELEGKGIVGIARLSRLPGNKVAQMTMLIADSYHHQGLGKKFVELLIQIAHQEGIQNIQAKILEENEGMLAICGKLGFTLTQPPGSKIVYANLKTGE